MSMLLNISSLETIHVNVTFSMLHGSFKGKSNFKSFITHNKNLKILFPLKIPILTKSLRIMRTKATVLPQNLLQVEWVLQGSRIFFFSFRLLHNKTSYNIYIQISSRTKSKIRLKMQIPFNKVSYRLKNYLPIKLHTLLHDLHTEITKARPMQWITFKYLASSP